MQHPIPNKEFAKRGSSLHCSFVFCIFQSQAGTGAERRGLHLSESVVFHLDFWVFGLCFGVVLFRHSEDTWLLLTCSLTT